MKKEFATGIALTALISSILVGCGNNVSTTNFTDTGTKKTQTSQPATSNDEATAKDFAVNFLKTSYTLDARTGPSDVKGLDLVAPSLKDMIKQGQIGNYNIMVKEGCPKDKFPLVKDVTVTEELPYKSTSNQVTNSYIINTEIVWDKSNDRGYFNDVHPGLIVGKLNGKWAILKIDSQYHLTQTQS